MTARDIGRRALLEAAVLKELAELNDETRQQLKEAGLEPGDRVKVGALGHVQMTDPQPSLRVVDWTAFTKWVEDHAPEAFIHKVELSSAFVAQLLKAGEYITAEGEVLIPDGIGTVAGTPQLRVAPSDVAHEMARGFIGAQLEIEAGQ